MLNQAAKFIAVTSATVLARLRGNPGLLPQEKIQERLNVCAACESLGSDGKCGICGCACDGRKEWLNKLAHPSSECPANPPKWGKIS